MNFEGRLHLEATGKSVVLVSNFVTTQFDLEKRVARRDIRLFFGLYRRHAQFPFDAIEGIGLKEYNTDGYSYLPVITLRGGERKFLSLWNGSALTIGPVVEKLREATGIARIDHKGTLWGT